MYKIWVTEVPEGKEKFTEQKKIPKEMMTKKPNMAWNQIYKIKEEAQWISNRKQLQNSMSRYYKQTANMKSKESILKVATHSQTPTTPC